MAVSKNVRFYIRNKKKSTPQPVYLSYFISKEERLFYPTGVKVAPKHWDNKLDKVKNVVLPELTTDNRHVHEIARYEKATKDNVNTYLENLRAVVDATVSRCFAERIPLSKEALEKDLNNYLNPPKAPEKISFYKFMDQYIEDLRSGERLVRGNRIADEKTVQRYVTAKNRLVAFGEYMGAEITFDMWSEDLWRAFIRYLTFEMKYKVNNIGFLQKQTLLYLKGAKKAKLIVDDWIDDAGIMSEEPDDVALYKDELEILEAHDFSDDERYDRIRDLALIGSFTGFRISDWGQINESNFKTTREGNRYIEIVPDKEDATPPSSPLHPKVERILTKYNGTLPVMAEQTFNRLFKEVCRVVGINEKSKVRYQKEGKVIVETVEKWAQVSSHTCRRSFATNMFLDKVEPRLIMKTTGHTTEKNFMKYLKLKNSLAVDAIAEHRKSQPSKNQDKNEGQEGL